ncbi:hypothetical protein Ssi02_31270 [Sinosporangium siamense]|uniref:Beta-lactamase n=1 Tax=Sinosporangium siamense TaxID=1367973 RepID=A0A919V7A9_9ACTN|nr:hypothetical protein Ssi02_31270 [Sinosporangium siamense]
MLLVTVLVMIGAGAVALISTFTQVHGSPEETARAYLLAWESSDFAKMQRLVVDPPKDFLDRHTAFGAKMAVTELTLMPGTLKRLGEENAELPFEGERLLRDIGSWMFSSTLQLVVADRTWKVRWGPEVLHPALKNGGRVTLTPVDAPGVEVVTRTGDPLPTDSAADFYTHMLADMQDAETKRGWVIDAVGADGRTTRLAEFKAPAADKVKTTLDRRVQAAAARALDGMDKPAAIVAVNLKKGEVLAIADRLGEQRNVVASKFAPGSTFKVVTTFALLSAGLSPDTQVACPGSYTIPQHRSFRNDGEVDRGTISLRSAFAHSCNTTMVEQITKLPMESLREAAGRLGFGRSVTLGGVGGECGQIRPPTDLNWLGEDAIGQGSVTATPLCMALVAAAVGDGTWRAPTLLLDTPSPAQGDEPTVRLPEGPVEALRSMMRAVVSEGTAASAGLPPGTAGKTGTAETGQGMPNAWFIGYRDELAFAVLVLGGGSGGQSAAPLAARFLSGI